MATKSTPKPQAEEPQVSPLTPTPPQYTTGWVRQDPVSLAVAVRTTIPDPDSLHDWGVMTVDRGGHYSGWDDVAGWTDLTTG